MKYDPRRMPLFSIRSPLPVCGGVVLVAVLSGGGLTAAETPPAQTQPATQPADEVGQSFLSINDLVSLRERDPHLLLVDARNAVDFERSHIPGAINLPPEAWRTPLAKPGEGESQYLFRNAEGELDVPRYEAMLGEAGITRATPVVVYGNFAGKADGSVPVMILDMLGHERAMFLDGVGIARWETAGHPIETGPGGETTRAVYRAEPVADAVWNLADVQAHLNDPQVVFHDTRSAREYDGRDKRDNTRGGHIPGAVLLDYADLLDPRTQGSLPREQARRLLEERGITPEKTVVLYCQTATRVSLPYLLMRDMGYPHVKVYDASWHEYGNQEDTAVEEGPPAAGREPVP